MLSPGVALAAIVSPTGPARLSLAAVNASGPSFGYGSNVLVVTINRTPSIIMKYRRWLVAVLAVLLLAAGYFFVRGRENGPRIDPSGLVAVLRNELGATRSEHTPSGRRARDFKFALVQNENAQPRVENARIGTRDQTYVVRRDGHGGLLVRAPGDGERAFQPGDTIAQAAAGIQLTVIDRRAEPAGHEVPSGSSGPNDHCSLMDQAISPVR